MAEPAQTYGATEENRQLNNSNGPSRRSDSKPKDTVEPKVYLANERTLLAWLRLAIVLSTFAVTLFNGVDAANRRGRIVALVYAVIAAITIAYAYHTYYNRLRRITRKSYGHFDELKGPVVVCFALCAAILINFIIKVRSPDSKVRPPKSPWVANILARTLPEGAMANS